MLELFAIDSNVGFETNETLSKMTGMDHVTSYTRV
jgi:hypothetical protein